MSASWHNNSRKGTVLYLTNFKIAAAILKLVGFSTVRYRTLQLAVRVPFFGYRVQCCTVLINVMFVAITNVKVLGK